MPLADAVAISFASPLVVTALSMPMLGERVGLYRWSAVIIGFVGVLVIVNPGGDMVNLGAVVAVVAAFVGGLVSITLRQLNRIDAPVTIVFYFILFSSLFTSLPLPFFWVAPTAQDWGLAVLLGLCGGCAQYFMTRA
jgi:drug/metabolite transporter (DMT)-like permease